MRRPHWDNNGVKKGSWSPDEDQKLTDYITRYGIWNWTLMPKYAGLSRNGKSCRLRWLNYLNPQNKRGNITKEEARTIFNLYAKLGKRWSAIAAKLPGRTDNEIKNYWHTHFKKHLKEKALPKTEYEGIDLHSSVVDPLTLDSSSIDDVTSNSLKSTEDGVCNFWSQPFLYENNEQESHIHQARCHCPEPSSPYDFYNNEYCFCHLFEADQDGWNEYRISSSSETILDILWCNLGAY